MNNPLHRASHAGALALLQQAVGGAARVVPPAVGEYDAEILRDGTAPIPLRFRPRRSAADRDLGPGEVWLLGRPDRAELKELRARGEDFVAMNGAVRIVRDWLLLDRTDLAPMPTPRGITRRTDPFADRNSLIARALLADPRRVWGVRELAAHAGVALGTASQVLAALKRSRIVRFEQQGRAARVWTDDPFRLLSAWFAAYSWERNDMAAFNAPVGDPSRFIRRLPDWLKDTRWALTLHAGASLVAPLATWERVHAYVDVRSRAELLQLGRAQGWAPADDGALVLMKPFYRTSVWEHAKEVGSISVVSELQLVLDLWHYPLRGREQAEHLLGTALNLSP